MRKGISKRRSAGVSMIEFALIAPILMMVGLGLVQVGMVFHGKNALHFALQEAARSGADGNASPTNIQEGLLRGMVPFMGGGTSAADLATTLAGATTEFGRGIAEGWIKVQQLSPSPQSFQDWQVSTTDENGNPVTEIPNANLPILRCTQTPNGGASGYRASTACGGAGEPVGSSSEQTLADANLLKLKMTYGVQLGVPFVNRIVVKALSMMKGCSALTDQRLGVIDLGKPTVTGADPTACAAYNAVDASGNPDPRIPVSIAITVRMQTPARSANNSGWYDVVARSRNANTSGAQLGNGTVDPASDFAPLPVSQINPNGVTLANDTQNKTGVGSTEIGDPNSGDTLGDPGPPITCTGN